MASEKPVPSPEPWYIDLDDAATPDQWRLVSYDIRRLAQGMSARPNYCATVYSLEDAERIVACVNLCVGIPNETLTSATTTEGSFGRRLASIPTEEAVRLANANAEAMTVELDAAGLVEALRVARGLRPLSAFNRGMVNR